jgi:hypothetical protein
MTEEGKDKPMMGGSLYKSGLPGGPRGGLGWALLILTVLAARASDVGTAVKEMNLVNAISAERRIVLIGASIGKAWNIEKLPERIRRSGFVFEYVGTGTFEKGPQLKEILGRTPPPAAVILKECAAYFPGDLKAYESAMRAWALECRARGVVPILATVVPVTRLHNVKKFLIDIVKFRNPFKFGGPFREKRLRSILAYNDWLRGLAAETGAPLLDLEAALRRSAADRRLKSEWARYDGLHLKPGAYKVLDKTMASLLDSLPEAPPGPR